MKINIVLGPFLGLPPCATGAVEKVWSQLADGFSSRGHDVVLYSRRDDCPDYPRASFSQRRLQGEVRSGSFLFDLALDFRYSFRAWRALPKNEVIVCNSFFLPFFLSLSFWRGNRIIYNLARYPKWQLWLYSVRVHIVSVSQPVSAEAVRQAPWLSARTSTIGNPIDYGLFSGKASESRHDALPLVIGYGGRIHPEKGVHLLVNAFRQLLATGVDAKLVLVGPWETEHGGGGTEYFGQIEKMLQDLPHEIVGPVFDAAAYAERVSAMDIFCYPSLAEKGESFGVSPLEAMAAGCAVVVSDLAVFRDFVSPDGNALVFDHRSDAPVDTLLAALRTVALDVDLRSRIARAAVETAKAFDTPAITSAYLEVFSSGVG